MFKGLFDVQTRLSKIDRNGSISEKQTGPQPRGFAATLAHSMPEKREA